MRLRNPAFFAVTVAVALMLSGFSSAQGASGWTNNGNIDHTDVTQNVAGDIHVEGKIDGGSVVNLTSTAGSITIDGKVDGGSNVTLKAAGDIRIGVVGGDGDKKIDGNSRVSATSGGGITLGNKIDGGAPNLVSHSQYSLVFFSANNGIDIGNKIDGGSWVKLCTVSGKIHIHDKIDNRFTEVWYWPNGSLIVDGGVHGGAMVTADHADACTPFI